jgi:hypothetical protein
MIRDSRLDAIASDAGKVEALCMDGLQMPSASNRFARAICEEAREENYD